MFIKNCNSLSAALKFERCIENQLLNILGQCFHEICLYACANEENLHLNFRVCFSKPWQIKYTSEVDQYDIDSQSIRNGVIPTV